jgi:hypothetical protein
LIKRSVTEDFFHNLLKGNLVSYKLQRLGVAFLGAGAADLAFAPVEDMPALHHLVSAVRTDPETVAAADTLGRIEGQAGLPGQGLGIVAPDAAQRAPLHENRSADTRAIMNGKALYLENGSPDFRGIVFRHRSIPCVS